MGSRKRGPERTHRGNAGLSESCNAREVPRQAALTAWHGSQSDQKLTRNVNCMFLGLVMVEFGIPKEESVGFESGTLNMWRLNIFNASALITTFTPSRTGVVFITLMSSSS